MAVCIVSSLRLFWIGCCIHSYICFWWAHLGVSVGCMGESGTDGPEGVHLFSFRRYSQTLARVVLLIHSSIGNVWVPFAINPCNTKYCQSFSLTHVDVWLCVRMPEQLYLRCWDRVAPEHLCRLASTSQTQVFKKEAVPRIASEVGTTFRVKNIQGTLSKLAFWQWLLQKKDCTVLTSFRKMLLGSKRQKPLQP